MKTKRLDELFEVRNGLASQDVAVLKPKRKMTLREKLFYAMCISRNRFKFSYGRKPKGEKLEAIMLPSTISEQFNDIELLPDSLI